MNNYKRRLLRPASTFRTFISRELFRDLRCCTNSYGKMRVSSTDASGRAAPIIIGAFGLSGLHPLVVNPEGARESQHATKSSLPTKGGKLPRNKKDEGEEKTGGRTMGKRQARACSCVKRRLKNRPTHAFASWHDWGLLASERFPFFPSLFLNSDTDL